MLGGALLQAVHFHKVKEAYSKTPIAVAVGPSETGKSLDGQNSSSNFGLGGCNLHLV